MRVEPAEPPAEVAGLVEDVCAAVQQAFGARPDLTPETLPLVDGYLREVVADLPVEEREERVVAVGAYFGEVARRKLEARWSRLEREPHSWRVELSSCFLHFGPVGMAGESLVGCESEQYDGTFGTLDELHDELAEMLSSSPQIPEDEYFSLAGRLEVLCKVADWLVGRTIASAYGANARGAGARGAPPTFSADDYRVRLDDDLE